ncbi:hypothetical protein V2J09_017343 [Rumex salicifolius]
MPTSTAGFFEPQPLNRTAFLLLLVVQPRRLKPSHRGHHRRCFPTTSLLLPEKIKPEKRQNMSKFFAKIAGFFSNRTLMGVDKAGNHYFTRNEVMDGVTKEKRWVIFKVEQDPTSIPVEWICWLNGQRKAAPTAEEMLELEARREFVRQNVERLKKEEEEIKARQRTDSKRVAGKVGGPDLQSFLRQLPTDSQGVRHDASEAAEAGSARTVDTDKTLPPQEEPEPHSTSEPTGSGPSFRPGTWQPPS